MPDPLGIFNTAQQLGNAIGAALVGAIFATVLATSSASQPWSVRYASAFVAGSVSVLALLSVAFGLSLGMPRHMTALAASPTLH